jgi:hypothetical protein
MKQDDFGVGIVDNRGSLNFKDLKNVFRELAKFAAQIEYQQSFEIIITRTLESDLL